MGERLKSTIMNTMTTPSPSLPSSTPMTPPTTRRIFLMVTLLDFSLVEFSPPLLLFLLVSQPQHQTDSSPLVRLNWTDSLKDSISTLSPNNFSLHQLPSAIHLSYLLCIVKCTDLQNRKST